MKSLNKYAHKELMALPHRQWDIESEYASLLIVSCRVKHDSGWAVMAIIGVDKTNTPVEIACGCCDDIEWKLPPMKSYGNGMFNCGQFRTDCAFKSGALHVWQTGARFKVGVALSSTEIEMIRPQVQP